MDHFGPDELLFEIPVYRLSPDERVTDLKNLIAKHLKEAEAEARKPGSVRANETADERIESVQRGVRRGHGFLRRFFYNEMIGVIRLYQDDGSIKGELWRQPHERFRRDWVHRAYQPWTRVIEYHPALRPRSSIDVYHELLDQFNELPTGDTLKGRYLDLHAFRRVGQHIDWLEVLGWREPSSPAAPPTTTILSGWSEQYRRMLRSHARLIEIAEGRITTSSDQARDALLHFYQDAYHLKDWIKNDSEVPTSGVETWINEAPPLRLCADLCNGSKHLKLTRSRTCDLGTSLAGQDVTVRPGPIGHPASPPLHRWKVESGGQSRDAVKLAGDVVRDWRSWLRSEGLLDSELSHS